MKLLNLIKEKLSLSDEDIKGIEDELKQPEIKSYDGIVKELTAKIEAQEKVILELRAKDAERQKAYEENAKAENEKKISETLKQYKEKGIIPAQNEEIEKSWRKQLETDFDGANKILSTMVVTTAKPEETKQTEKVTTPKNGLEQSLPENVMNYVSGTIAN